ncbi:GNAT family N-acetyltransferase [Radiobacillus sp. PE A8.2]|uniref:GNAT family N-acetyltransferase n=1 Tax=Radiobacillus sp. PE A8.2 TaxID=3380349 RepID=UPI003890E9EC
MDYIITTDRLNMRLMLESDQAYLSKIFSDPVAMTYYPSTKTQEEVIRWINWTLNNYRKFGVGLWIVEDKQTGAFLGQCGIVPQKVDGQVQMEIGYLFTRQVWGKGYATEAALGCKRYGFEQLNVPQLISLIDPDNHASIRVAEKIGMAQEKTISKWDKQLYLYKVVNQFT